MRHPWQSRSPPQESVPTVSVGKPMNHQKNRKVLSLSAFQLYPLSLFFLPSCLPAFLPSLFKPLPLLTSHFSLLTFSFSAFQLYPLPP
jgi:hypothetical protein